MDVQILFSDATIVSMEYYIAVNLEASQVKSVVAG